MKELYICKIFIFLLSGVKLFRSQGMKKLGVFMELSPTLMIISAELPGWHLIISEQCSGALPPLPNGCWIAYPCLLQHPGWVNSTIPGVLPAERIHWCNNWSKSSPCRVLAQPLHILLALGCVVWTPTITESCFSLCSAGVNAVIFHFSKNRGLGWLRVTSKVSSVALTSSLVDVCLQYKPTTWAGTIHHHWRSSAIWDPGKHYLRVLKATAGVN